MTALINTLMPEQFVLLRPWWLLALVPLPWVIWRLARRQPGAGRWQEIIDSHLLRVLLQQGKDGKPSRWPLLLIAIAWLLTTLALAGPSFRSLDTPLFQRNNARVYLLDLSPSMNADDVKPSRLARARLKLLDALNQQRDGEQALIVYAGSSHVLTPLASDARTLAAQVPVLTTALPPVSGNRPELALQRAVQMLHDTGHSHGEIIWITDGIDADQTDRVIEAIQNTMPNQITQLAVLAIGTAEGAPVRQNNGALLTDKAGKVILARLDLAPLQTVVNAVSGRIATLQTDDSDWQALQFPEQSLTDSVLFNNTRRADGSLQLREDAGGWFVLPLLVLVLLAFRRGSLLPVCLLAITAFSPRSEAGWWQNLWQTADQQAAQQMAAGDTKAAAQTFQNPLWRAAAQYRNGDYENAANGFSHGDPNNLFNRGNALAKAGKLDEAIAAYDEALKQKSDFVAAKENRDAVEKLRQKKQQQDQKENKNQQQKEQEQQGGAGEDQAAKNQQSEQQKSEQNGEQKQNQQTPQQQSPSSESDDEGARESAAKKPEEKEPQASAEAKEQTGKKDQAQQEQSANADAKPANTADTATQDDEQNLPANERPLPTALKQLPDDPGGLLRRKMKLEYLRRGQETQKQDQEQRW